MSQQSSAPQDGHSQPPHGLPELQQTPQGQAAPAGDDQSQQQQQQGQIEQPDTTLTKIFVGGLSWDTKSDSLHRHFAQYGEILEAVVLMDKATGRSKGYGFVTFADPAVAQQATANPNPTIDNRRANCNLAALGAKRPSDGGNGGGFGGGYGSGSPRGGGRGGRRFDYNGGMSRGGGGAGGRGGGGRGNYQNQQQYYQPQHQQLQQPGGYFIGPNGQPVFQPQFFQMGMPMPQMQPNGGGYQMAAPIDLQGGIAIPADAAQMQLQQGAISPQQVVYATPHGNFAYAPYYPSPQQPQPQSPQQLQPQSQQLTQQPQQQQHLMMSAGGGVQSASPMSPVMMGGHGQAHMMGMQMHHHQGTAFYVAPQQFQPQQQQQQQQSGAVASQQQHQDAQQQ